MSAAVGFRQDRLGMIVIFGPTASGKSGLALHLAEAHRGTIINADSMQLYRDLRILTARPDPDATGRAPHELYGVLGAHEVASVGDWLVRVETAMAEASAADRLPIVVGGTGLYIRALLDGIAPVPPIAEEVRADVRYLYAQEGVPGLRARLKRADPAFANEAAAPGDPQRLMRALEVVLSTDRSLSAWQAEAPRRLDLPHAPLLIALAPPRAELASRIEIRLRAMVASGALEEVRALRSLGLAQSHPLMKALAVRPLLGLLAGEIDRGAAIRKATVETRRYAKRQFTWLRHRMPDFTVHAAFGDALIRQAADEPAPGSFWPGSDGRVAEPGVDAVSGDS